MIGQKILELRLQRRWSQVMLSKRLSVSVKAVKNWENGTSDPSAENLIQLAEIFSVSVDYLLGLHSDDLISLKGLTQNEKQCIVAMIQAYIQVVSKQRNTPS